MIQIRADRSLIRAAAKSRRYLSIELRAPEAPPREGRLPVNIAFVIDRSGSMHGAKIAHARQAVLQGIRTLHDGDHFAVVAYDDEVELVVPTTEATSEARAAAVAKVERIATRGSTNLHGGSSAGCEQVAAKLTSEAVGRCLLLTDGLANAGVTDHDEIVRQCAGWRDRRVVTTTFGLGAGFDEELLRRMSDAGGGNFQFIESEAQIADCVASEVGEALATTVREGVLVVDAGDGAVVESLNDFPCRQEGATWRIAFGSLFGGQSITQVLCVTFPQGEPGQTRDVTVRVEDQDGALAEARGAARFTCADHAANDAQPRDRVVDRQAATLFVARAERDALERNRRRDFQGAREVLEACAARIQAYAGDDAELQSLVARLERQARLLGRPVSSVLSKTLYSESYLTLKSRVVRAQRIAAEARARGSTVPTEWDVREAVERALQELARVSPEVLHSIDLTAIDIHAPLGPVTHLDPGGCMLDLLRDASGRFELRLEAPDLCPACRSVVLAAGVAPDDLQRVVLALRMLGTPSGVVH